MTTFLVSLCFLFLPLNCCVFLIKVFCFQHCVVDIDLDSDEECQIRRKWNPRGVGECFLAEITLIKKKKRGETKRGKTNISKNKSTKGC